MAKITIGPSHDQSMTIIEAKLLQESQMELYVGDAYDMSIREIAIFEREVSEVNAELSRIHDLIAELKKNSDGHNTKVLCREATVVADTTKCVIEKRRWYSISVKGLVEAAKSVGEAASPIVISALKIIELLQKTKI